MNTQLEKVLLEICGDNNDAHRFCNAWINYVHRIDDLVDGDLALKPENLVKTLVNAAEIYSSNFYQQNAQYLYPIVCLVSNDYIDSEILKNDLEPLFLKWAEYLSFSGIYMLQIVALICGGYDNMRKVSIRLRECSLKDHYNTVTGERI